MFGAAVALTCGAAPARSMAGGPDAVDGQGVTMKARVKLPEVGSAPTDPCASARRARERNSPSAAGLEARCAAVMARTGSGGQVATREAEPLHRSAAALSERGRIIAQGDPYAMSMRAYYAPGEESTGAFYFGLALAEGRTEWGADDEGLVGVFEVMLRVSALAAAEATMDRNRNTKRVAIGWEIAQADPELAAARKAHPDPRFWLGFDVATAIFGDPALGAQGNTELGPGSLGTRAALSDLGKLGFDAAVKLHFSRNYRQ
jgi:hypothetical protein